MAQCPNCKHRFSWFDMFLPTMVIKKDIIVCPQCEQKLFFKAKAKKKVISSTFFTLFGLTILLLLMNVLQISHTIIACIMVVFVIGLVLLVPTIVEVTSEQESLF